jgi:hypothetical protein
MVDKMMNLDRRWGPCSGRVWGLILNFIGNGLAIYGSKGMIRDGSRIPILIIGLLVTLVCILLLARPYHPVEEKHDSN